MKLATIRIRLFADLGTTGAARVIVLVATRQHEQELLSNGRCLLAAGAKEARRLQLAKAVYHADILDQERWAGEHDRVADLWHGLGRH